MPKRERSRAGLLDPVSNLTAASPRSGGGCSRRLSRSSSITGGTSCGTNATRRASGLSKLFRMPADSRGSMRKWLHPSHAVMVREDVERFEAAFAKLSPQQQHVITATRLLGHIAAELGKSEGAVRVLLHRAARPGRSRDGSGDARPMTPVIGIRQTRRAPRQPCGRAAGVRAASTSLTPAPPPRCRPAPPRPRRSLRRASTCRR